MSDCDHNMCSRSDYHYTRHSKGKPPSFGLQVGGSVEKICLTPLSEGLFINLPAGSAILNMVLQWHEAVHTEQNAVELSVIYCM